MGGTVIEIHIAETDEHEMSSQNHVTVEAQKGIVGDRYHGMINTFTINGQEIDATTVTFIESEMIDKFNQKHNTTLAYSDMRRNVITKGISLNDLVGKTFTVGSMKYRGLELCEPCTYISKKVHERLIFDMVGKSGIRAEALSSGTLSVNDNFNDEE